LGLGGIALNSMLAAEISKKTHHTPRARNVIFLFMCGGASHLETFDPKPTLKKYAGRKASDIFTPGELKGFNPEKRVERTLLLPSVFDFKQHGQSGAWISEIFPHLTQVADEICFIKSMHTDSAIHSVGEQLMHTGHGRPGFPSIGSWCSYGLGCESQNLPAYVVMKDGITSAGDGVFQQGILPGKHQAAVAKVGQGKLPFPFLNARQGMSHESQSRHLATINRLNRMHRDRFVGQPELNGRIEAFETAFRMQASAPEVFDLSREPENIRKLYGESLFSQHCLAARRLIESGVRFVEILDGAPGRRWDAHGNRGGLIDNHRTNAARTDQGITALILDLKMRGLLDETLVVWATEFGRTPFEEANKEIKIGRGHSHKGFTMWMAGGGVKPGISFGATDRFGMQAVEDPVSFHDFHATLLHVLGLDHERLTYRHNGRDIRLTDVFGNVVTELIT
tara:strand:- start:15 stop:1370 length:1356 start_codon:yes stop_codon:yes gene_type:complete